MKPCTMVYTWNYLFTKLHGVTPDKTIIFKFTDVRTSERKLKNFHQNANNRIHFIKKYIPSALWNYDWSLNPAFYQQFKNVFDVNVIKACRFQVRSLLGWWLTCLSVSLIALLPNVESFTSYTIIRVIEWQPSFNKKGDGRSKRERNKYRTENYNGREIIREK
jgi:hypothetical protein